MIDPNANASEMTVRAVIAGACLQGLLSQHQDGDPYYCGPGCLTKAASQAVLHADALIEELNRTQTKE